MAEARRYFGMQLNHNLERREVVIPAGGIRLEGELTLPARATGLVLFAHGSGSSRHSPRNQYVAGVLREAGMGTLLFDLLTAREEEADSLTGHLRFNISLLTNRLVAATHWAGQEGSTHGLSIGYFGSSTGAAGALMAAAELARTVECVVSRGGRPDLAASGLERVMAPTLLIVGGDDEVVLCLNERAYAQLKCEKALKTIPGATHLFAEPGALDHVARLAAGWFAAHLKPLAHRN
jgi:putative phosphoribosyl transferase